MPGYLLDQGVAAQCPHIGQVQATPGQTRVRIKSQAVLGSNAALSISSCQSLTLSSGAIPNCSGAQWLTTATRIKISGQPALLVDSTAQWLGSAVVAPPVVLSSQNRVRGM